MSELEALIDGLADRTRGHIERAVSPLAEHCKRIDTLEQAIVAFQKAVEELRAVAPVPGPKGDDGADGADGKDGAPGKDGIDGKNGIDGIAGKDADEDAVVARVLAAIPAPKDGANGANGADGANGKDADEDAIVQRVLAAIPTPKDGADGINGKDGAPGINGKDGVNGKDFDPILMHSAVAKAIAEIPKPVDGRDGRDGLEGQRGQDAIDIEYVDLNQHFARSYVRGTHAKYRGGIVRATRTTDAVVDGDLAKAGWEVIVDGFPTFHVEHDGKRAFAVVVTRTDGRSEKCAFSVPVTIDCGVFKLGSQYEKGDGATWGGSYWIAQRDTDEQPGISDAWRLAVKKGRDAK